MRFIFTAHFLLLAFFAQAQMPADILRGAYHKCQSVREGNYVAVKEMKYLTRADTLRSRHACTFQKLADDALFHMAFFQRSWVGAADSSVTLYTGQALVRLHASTQTAEVMDATKWRDEIASTQHNFTFFEPLTAPKSAPLPTRKGLRSMNHNIVHHGVENVGGVACHHVQLSERVKNRPREAIQTLRMELHFWIRISDSLPLQYSTAYDVVMQGDTMSQYERMTLLQSTINQPISAEALRLSAVPNSYSIVDYAPTEVLPPLAVGAAAPAWELPSLNSNPLNLNDFRGKLVLLDFFYRSCYPCMLALPSLQKLHATYAARGLQVVGIDPKDHDAADLKAFLEKRGVTYPILLGSEEIAKRYHVQGYPTAFLIDKEGKILQVEVGFGPSSEQKLEEVILKNL